MTRTAALENRTAASLRTPSTGGASLSLEVRHDLEWSPDDAARLDALIESRPRVGVFLTSAWLSGWFAEPPPGCQVSIVVLREGGELRGILPLAIRHTLTCAYVRPLGGGIGSDRIDLLAARGFEARFADLWLDWLGDTFGTQGFVLELRDVPDDSAVWGAIRRAVERRRLPLVVTPLEIHTHPYLNLDEPHADSNSTVKHRRWLQGRGALRIDMVEGTDATLFAFELLVQWLRARWSHGTSALDADRTQRFHRHALPLLLREGRLRMIRLSSDMRPIAVFYGLTSGRPAWWGYYLAGYDREWAGRIHLGQITLATAIELAAREGAREFDFLKGAEAIKYSWPVRERVTVDADVYSAGAAAQLTRAARATREAAAALTKAARACL